MKKPELLAPAGDMACLRAAINAGADAVYFGGEEYGARAYASNFSTEELCEAVSYAHLFDVKVYLTVNTLVKEREFAHLAEFLMPVYKAGLDGVIVQDIGVLKMIREEFPDLPLHASTQMCIANAYGAELLKEDGVSRIVPARELSLAELKAIKEQVDIEIECFIHGAMCYCYSGQCLFSSFLGGRSGNRGRCAGPCRLPYEAFGQKEKYPLSLKDLCTVSMIGELTDAGIDSFKIEGRMKNPYYVAGVTSIYRKYIDRYLKADGKAAFVEIEKADMEILRNLYIRTELQDGYFHRHNGKEMITLQKPGYVSASEDMFSDIKAHFLDRDKQLPVKGELTVQKGSPLVLKIYDIYGHETTVTGHETVTEALKSPVTAEDIQKQMYKTGNTAFYFDEFSVIMDDNVFISLKSLGEIRRTALEDFKQKLLLDKRVRAVAEPIHKETNNGRYTAVSCKSSLKAVSGENVQNPCYRICCLTKEQLLCAADFIRENTKQISVDGIEIQAFLLKELNAGLKAKLFALKENGIGLYLVLPSVFRKQAADWLKDYEALAFSDLFDGYYCGGLDAFAYIRSRVNPDEKQIIADYALYICNFEAFSFLRKQGACGFVVPHELSNYEWQELNARIENADLNLPHREYTVYGYIPFMQTANCIKKSFDRCNGKQEVITLKDRMGKNLFAVSQCEICENTIYNSVPLSLHKEIKQLRADVFRLCFTVEAADEMLDILHAFADSRDVPYREFTKGHFKKGIE